jgi:hypothetical protein
MTAANVVITGLPNGSPLTFLTPNSAPPGTMFELFLEKSSINKGYFA